jgi:outer membrane protein
MQAMGTEYQNTAKKYEAEVDTKTEKEHQKRGLELQETQQRIQNFQTDTREDLAKKQTELFKPIQEKAFAAINKVCIALGFEYVLDSNSLIAAHGKDILTDVKKELGI